MGLTAPPPYCKVRKKFSNQEIPQEHWNPRSISVRTDDGSFLIPKTVQNGIRGLLHFSSPKKQFKTQKNSSKRN
jgi:hypothetical protein